MGGGLGGGGAGGLGGAGGGMDLGGLGGGGAAPAGQQNQTVKLKNTDVWNALGQYFKKTKS
jgi:hypothetical protein